MWITVSIPKIEDGNNFGVSIQVGGVVCCGMCVVWCAVVCVWCGVVWERGKELNE